MIERTIEAVNELKNAVEEYCGGAFTISTSTDGEVLLTTADGSIYEATMFNNGARLRVEIVGAVLPHY